VVTNNPPQLVRNYDYHPNLSEGTIWNSAWNNKHVIAVNDCLWGVVDGMNSDGLVVSLTFGGKKTVGKGFGIPFILRYVLEFCSSIEEAVGVLNYIPSHMAYNIMLLDKKGRHKMIQVVPETSNKVTDAKVATNHQEVIDWPEHAAFSKTLEREKFLRDLIKNRNIPSETVANAFLKPPLFKRQYRDGFGTIYTSVYRPAEGYMELIWEDQKMVQSFANFEERDTLINYREEAEKEFEVVKPVYKTDAPHYATSNYWEEYGKSWATGNQTELSVQIAKGVGNALGLSGTVQMEKLMETFAEEHKKRGQVPWEILADLWANFRP